MLAIIMGVVVLGLAIYFMNKRGPYLLGLGALVAVLMFVSSLQVDTISSLAIEFIRSIMKYAFIVLLCMFVVKTIFRKIVYIATLIGVSYIALTMNNTILSLLTILVVLWILAQKRRVVKNIVSCYEVNKDIEYGKAFIIAAWITLYLYNVDGGVDYLIMLLINLMIVTVSLNNHVYNYKKIQAVLNQAGYVEVKKIQENILSGKIQDKDIYVLKILERIVEKHKCICIKGKKKYFVLHNICEKIEQGVKERKSIEQIESMIKDMTIEKIPKEVVVAVKTASNIDLGVRFESRMANFLLMKYSFDNHPIVGECEKVKNAYWEGVDYILDKYSRSIMTYNIIKNNLRNALGIKFDYKRKSDNMSDVMRFIVKASNIIWHGGLNFGKRDIRFVFVLESMYIVAVSLGHIDYDTMRECCDLLKITKQEYRQIERFMERIFQPDKEIDTIINDCKNSNLRFAMEYVSHVTRALMHFPSLPRYRVAVCATMSSGKSTFINALLGRDFIPSGNQACTAKITAIEDNDMLGQKVLGSSMTLNGETFYEDNVSSETLKEWNQRDDINSVYLETDLQNVSSEENVLAVYDTPGTNYSQDATHKAQTMDFLKSHKVDMILYLINAEHSSTNDNKILLSELKENILSGREKKIIFLINKFDSLEGDDIKLLVEDVRNELEEMGFVTPVILPVSANAARLFRMAMSEEEFTKREIIEFEDMFELFSVEKFDVTKYLDLNMQNMGRNDMENVKGKVKVGGKEYDRKTLMEATIRTGIIAVTAYVNQEINKVGIGRKVA